MGSAKGAIDRVADIALAFPEATRMDKGTHAQFLVKRKTFAYFLDNHHGDGIVSICCKVLPGDNAALVKSDPRCFYLPAYIGPRGWVALRLDVGKVDWEDVRELLKTSYVLCAPKKLAVMVGQEDQK
jgi:phosphoribosylglycinamide formyltransferase-1